MLLSFVFVLKSASGAAQDKTRDFSKRRKLAAKNVTRWRKKERDTLEKYQGES